MDAKIFKDRTKRLALEIMCMVETLPNTRSTDVIARQALRSATSIGANYRAACRAKSPADMVTKLKIVEEEADETIYWLELLVDGNKLPVAQAEPLVRETSELLAMTVASIKTPRARSSRA